MNNTTIIIKNLSVNLQDNIVLDNISFALKANQHLSIIGNSGSGKTMLAKALAGKLFYQGTVDCKNCSINFVEQHYHFKNLSHTNDFYYQQRYNSFDSEDAPIVLDELKQIAADESITDLRIETLLNELGLQHRKNAPILQLSSGEHKRFQLIKALLAAPQILILDYPFIGLDIKSREKLHNIINEVAQNGTQIILITDAHEIPQCITHILHLEKGKQKSFKEKEYFNDNALTRQYAFHHFNFNALTPVDTENNFSVAVKMVNASVQYNDKIILHKLNWEVKREDKWLVKGRNGVGKSTLLSLITGDNPKAYANEIYLFDKRKGSGESIWDIKKKIGYVSPELHWYFDTSITCYQTIGSGFFDTVGLYKKLDIQQHNILQQWLDFLRLSHVANKPLNSISTGQQRLILLSRALVKNPPLLVLDEPCQGLDQQQKNDLVQLVDELCEQFNKTLIYVSHYDNEIPSCIDKVIELKDKKQNIYFLNTKTAIAV